MGVAYEKLDRPEAAESAYRSAARKNSRFFEAHWFLGQLLVREGRTREALEPLRQALNLRPNHAAAILAYGLACLETGNRASAEQQLELLLVIDPVRAEELRRQLLP